MFREATSTPLSGSVLHSPQHMLPVNSTKKLTLAPDDQGDVGPRKSPRLREMNKSGKTIIKMA
jgi:hypothetical protein